MTRHCHIAMLVVAILIILILLCLGGCATRQQSAQVIWNDGQCLLFVDGISAEQAGLISRDWEFKNCEVKVESELGESEEGAGDSAEVESP